jgi:glycosyltransferase involved in cell wall biosynthesis
MKKQLTIIMPAHNEAQGIFKTLLEIDEFTPPLCDLTIFVSEDGSSDNTRQEVMNASKNAKNCKIQLSSNSKRLGYSRAVLRGIRECKTEWIGFMDADGQYDPRDIQKLLDSLTENKLVCGYRNPRNDSKLRIIYSRFFNLAYRSFGGPKLIDPSSPFIFCSTNDISYLNAISPLLNYGFWWEFQMRLAANGVKVKEIPVAHRKRVSGSTQVYKLSKMPKIIVTHLIGLAKLKKQLK